MELEAGGAVTPQVLLKHWAPKLKVQGITNPTQELRWLISDVLDISPMDLYLREHLPLTDSALVRIGKYFERRLAGEPLAYIAKKVEFAGLTLYSTPQALIPRPETEELAGLAGQILSTRSTHDLAILDLACGSGCLALALKYRFPNARVAGSDLSKEACALAERNSQSCQLSVEWRVGSWWDPWKGGRFDCILTNPPYIREDQWGQLDWPVRAFEPKLALISGVTGLECFWQIARDLDLFLSPRGIFIAEFGFDQAQEIQGLFQGFGHTGQILRDLQGKQRYFVVDRMRETQ